MNSRSIGFEVTESFTKQKDLILVVDDERIIRDLMDDILQMLGYDVIACGSPVEAIDIYKDKQDEISLIIMDMIMPVMNGRQLYNEINKINKNNKVILLSGYSEEHEIEQLLSDGILAFIQKPVSIDKLTEVIEYALKQ
jgi:CheY-like chemotaxis protein